MAKTKLLDDEEEVTKIYKFKAVYETLLCYKLGVLFKHGLYQTTNKTEAEALKKISGVSEIVEADLL